MGEDGQRAGRLSRRRDSVVARRDGIGHSSSHPSRLSRGYGLNTWRDQLNSSPLAVLIQR